MSKKSENSEFICNNCNKNVKPLTNGSYRNHCPHCLYSLHVDVLIGDRKNICVGPMKPVGVIYNSKKGYQIVHKCLKCGFLRVNKTAENTVMPDDLDLVLELMKESG